MRLFEKFLVNKAYAEASAVVEAVIQQQRQCSSYAEICLREKLLGADAILEVFETQHFERISFEAACQRRGLWTVDFEASLTKHMEQSKRPLGVYLLESGAIGIDRLVEAVDEFFGQLSEVEMAANQAVGPLLREPYLEVFSESLNAEILDAIQRLKGMDAAAEDRAKCIADLRRGILVVMGAARLCGLVNSENVLIRMQELLSRPLDKISPQDIEKICQSGFQLSWDVRQHVAAGGVESEYFASAERRSTLEAILTFENSQVAA